MDSFEDREDIDADQSRPRWFIDLDWYQQNNRSLFLIARSYWCPKCRERVKAKVVTKLESSNPAGSVKDRIRVPLFK